MSIDKCDQPVARESLRFAGLVCEASAKGIIKKCGFSVPRDSAVKNARARSVTVGGRRMIQLESFMKDGKALQRNIPEDDAEALGAFAAGFMRANLILEGGTACEYRANAKGNAAVVGAGAVTAALGNAAAREAAPAGNDRSKNRLLDGSEPFLRALGVSDERGRVYDKKQPKFRQICRFLEHIQEIESYLPAEGELRICDLCCGKSYLSFAVYHYFAVLRGRRVSMTGVDLKPDVIEYCSSVAGSLGFSGLEFICGNVLEYDSRERGLPQLVVSLHACDTATDIVLTKAAQWRAKVILSTPCCHHALARVIDCPELAFVTDHPFLSRKLCDVLTDAARLARLDAEGYVTTAMELTDPDDTPKNVLLRAVLDDAPEPSRLAACRERYESIRRFLAAGDPEGARGALPDVIDD